MAPNQNRTFFILFACLILSECVLGTVLLSATVPENARAGETVLSVWSATGRRREEQVRCEIVGGNKNGRFRVVSTTDCAIQVARPLDYTVDQSYNLTVNVTRPSSEQLYVRVQVQDVEGYPLVYNNTCEMPIRRADSRSGGVIFDVKITAEAVTKPGGVVFFSEYVENPPETTPTDSFDLYAYANNSNCVVQFVWETVLADNLPRGLESMPGILDNDNYDMIEVFLPVIDLNIQPVGCPPNKYGMLCDQNCTCENGVRCHGLNGACKCRPGWQGVVCDIPHSTVVITATPSDSRRIYITGSVILHCKAFHLTAENMIWTFPNETEKWLQGAHEDRIGIERIQPEHNGTYNCTVVTKNMAIIGASYELQAVSCPPGKMGELCVDSCECPRGASCDRWSGCVCPPGWTGTKCRTPCPSGVYGQGCNSDCRCQNQAACAPTDGRCNCTEGWFGRQCGIPCPTGLYGWRCRHDCGCKNNATCHQVDGSCACVPPWTGKRCDVMKTDEYTFPLLLQILIPLTLTMLVAVALVALYKRNTALNRVGEEDGLEEEKALLELRNMEEDLTQTLQPGWLNRWEKTVEDLTMGDLIGLGAFAQIRKGKLRTAGAKVSVAVKSVRGEERQFYRAFCREVASLIAVHQEGGHANIIRLYGVITKTTPRCLLLEYAAKGDLSMILRQQPRQDDAISLGDLLRYAVNISCALKELRRLRIAHGDVAARNVLISGNDVAKLADFGLAHDVYTATAYVSPDREKGGDELLPLKWMALESLESRKFTCESDTWSFGVLLWEIAASGKEPVYQHEVQLSCPRLVGILRQGVRLQKPPGCPDRLYDVMTSCWREEPPTRPDPIELEQKLTECRQELDPLLVMEKETLV
ncbi:uncharacterized protein [Branchiostoma lanceolatum]|uniref:uncharacterized protein n=1 Tax=Branchiostoma lanceolatum TaxID=7740 RepID=UPI003452800A